VRRTVLVLAAATVALLAAGATVAASHGSSNVADRVRAIEMTRLHALVDADTATARKLIAPDFQLINPGGGTSTRDEYMDAIKAGSSTTSCSSPARRSRCGSPAIPPRFASR
jgi:ABC-type glycerol-3-phosphate transport system substrate-binding protein